jgi:hypothetical protein
MVSHLDRADRVLPHLWWPLLISFRPGACILHQAFGTCPRYGRIRAPLGKALANLRSVAAMVGASTSKTLTA